MDDDRLHSGGFEQNDVAHCPAGQFRVLHGTAAEFDDDNVVAELLDVGKRFGEHFRTGHCMIFHIHFQSPGSGVVIGVDLDILV